MATSPKTMGRYEIRGVLGEGGMGVVYKAFDPVLKREVTLKTIRDAQDNSVLELFKRECDILAGMGGHPNIVEIFDIGETDDGTGRRPYFVMPLLKGVTLDQLIRTSSSRLTNERCVQMIGQMCRGLQAAHDQGLVHRDLKPANIFVLDDDSIKIIDFGVAHLTDQRSSTGLKGTLLYMAPEQLQMKKPSPLSDQFSLGVISYEMLTRRHPFNMPGHEDLVESILKHTPTPASDVNPVVPQILGQVVQKALAKDSFHRFANVREYAECLQKALRNEKIEIFDPARIEPRLQRAQKAFDEGDMDFAAEIVRGLKSESYLNPEIDRLDKVVSEASRNKTVKQLMETARRRFEEHEHVLALQKVQEVLTIDPSNMEAVTLHGKIENTRSAMQVEEWLQLAQSHLDNHAYAHAREAMEKLLDQRPDDARARTFLAEIDKQEQETARAKAEKKQAFEGALASFKRGEVDSALSKLELCIRSDRLTPTTSSDQTTAYQKLYDDVRSKRDQLREQEADAKNNLTQGKYDAAQQICLEVLKEYPDNVVFRVLQENAEQGQRKELSAFVAKVETEVAEQTDLERKVGILEEARARFPQEPRFEQSLRQVRSRKDLVDSIVARAHSLEESGQFSEAIAQWETLKNIHPEYHGLQIELERLTKRRTLQTRDAAKAGWITQIDQAVNIHNYTRAASLLQEAFAQFPGDQELQSLEQTIQRLSERQAEAEGLLAHAKTMEEAGLVDQGIQALRSAYGMTPHVQAVRTALLDLLLKHAGALLEGDWAAAEPFIAEATAIEPKNALAKSLRTLLTDKKQAQEVDQHLSTARGLQGQGKNQEALEEVDRALEKHPREKRLIQLRESLHRGLSAGEQEELRSKDLQELRSLDALSQNPAEDSLDTILKRTRIFRTKYSGDREFDSSLTTIENRLKNPVQKEVAVAAPSPVASPAASPAGKTKSPQSGAGEGAKSVSAKAADSKQSVSKQQIVYAVCGAVAALILLVAVLLFLRKPDAPKPLPTVARIPVMVTVDPGVNYRIEDSSGRDLTGDAENGLQPGNYRLKTTRPGFKPVDLEFTLGAGEQEHTVAPVWVALPVQLMVRGPRPATLTVDGTTLMQAEDGSFQKDLENGQYHVSWTSGRSTAGFDLEVKDGIVNQTNWKPTFAAFTALTDPKSINFEVSGLKLTVDGAPVPPTGSLDLPTQGQVVEFKESSGKSFLQLGRVDDGKFSAGLMVVLSPPGATQSRSSVSTPPPAATKQATPATSPVVAAPPPPVPAAPAAPPSAPSTRDKLLKRSGVQPGQPGPTQ